MNTLGVRTAFGDYLSLLSGRFITFPLQVVSVILVTRLLGKEGYGALVLFLLVSQIAFLFGINWTHTSIIRYGREEYVKEGKINKVFWGRNALLVPSVLLPFLFIFVFKEKIVTYIGIPPWGIWLLIFHILGLAFINYVFYLQQAVGKLRLLAVFQVAERLLILIGLSLIFIGLFPKVVGSVVAAYIVASFLVVVIAIGLFDKGIFSPIVFEKKVIKRIFFFSYPFIFGAISAYVINWIDIIVIKRYLTTGDVGIYTLAYQGMMVLQQISMVTITVTGPMMVSFLAQGKEDLILRYTRRIIPQGVFIWAMFLSVATFLMALLIPLVFGPDFMPSRSPFIWLMFGLGFNALACFCSPILTTYELIKLSMAVNVLIALLNLIGDFILVPKIGINGAAIATSFSFTVGAILYLVIVNQRLKLKEWKQVFSIFPIVVTIPYFLLIENNLLRLFGLIVIWIFSLMIARTIRLFQQQDLEILDKIDVPMFVKRVIRRGYSFFI